MASPKKKWLRMKALEDAKQAESVANALETQRVEEARIVEQVAALEALSAKKEADRLASISVPKTPTRPRRSAKTSKSSNRFSNRDED